jgi:hypothetical protein
VFILAVKRVVTPMLLFIALAFVSSGCAHNREGWHDTSLLRSIEYPEDAIPVLNEAANNRSGTEEDRARAIFTLFGRYLLPGCSSSEFHRVFTDVGWLQDARLYPIGAYTGWIPIDEPLEDTVFRVYLFPAGPDKRASQWHIYFRLTGRQQKEDALSFLQGTAPPKSAMKMAEYALCFPHSIYYPDRAIGRIERFSPRGVHVYEEMGR